MNNSTITKQFALKDLIISPENVRVVNPNAKADKELIAGIKSVGLLQNLIVDELDNGKGEVVAGGRRFGALGHLVTINHMTEDHLVWCRVRQEHEDVTELSLAENLHRSAMHPADEYVAFDRLKGNGFSVEEISQKFGISKKIVNQRLALGAVNPELIEQYRKGKIDLDSLMAFTIVSDHERQMACFKELSRNNNLYTARIKRWLIGESYNTNRGLGKFVGKAAFTKAGGQSSSDLFGEMVYLSDSELVVELANKKLEKLAKKVELDGWSWVEFSIDGPVNDMVRLQPELTGVPKKATEKLESLKAEHSEVEKECNSQGWPEELDEKYDAIESDIEKYEEDINEKYLKFTKAQMAYSGVVVSVNSEGEAFFDRGLARKNDVPQPKNSKEEITSDTETASTADTKQEKGGISQVLQDDIRSYRQQITQAALLQAPTLATDVLYYHMACEILSEGYNFGSLLDSRFNKVSSNTSRDDTQEGKAYNEIQAVAHALNTEWLAIENKGEQFLAFCNLKPEEKSLIVTYCVACSLSISHKGKSTGDEALISKLGVNYAEYWTPTKDNYFSRINVGQLKDLFKEVRGYDYEEHHKDSTKGAVVVNVQELMASHANGKGWLPEQF